MTDDPASEFPGRIRVGILGGTFDPPHIGHLVAASEALHRLDLDEIRFVVAGRPWQKEGVRDVTPAADRLAMVAAAVVEQSKMTASAIELDRAGPSYTADTLAELAAREPGVEWVLVVGADAADTMDTWDRIDEVFARAEIAVVNRPGRTAQLPAGARGRVIEMPAIDLSSTELRSRLASGVPCDLLIPAGALDEIRRRGLYRTDR